MGHLAHHEDPTAVSIRFNYSLTTPDGNTQPANEQHDEGRPRRGSFTLQSDGGSSVTTVSNLGFDAAPAPSLKCGCGSNGAGQDDTVGHFMTAEELQNHLNLQPTYKMSVAQSLRKHIWPAMLQSQQNDRRYLPLDAFETFFCKQSIKSLMKESGPPEMTSDALRNRVQQVHHGGDIENMQGRRRVLAILTMMDRLSYIDSFFENDVWDHNLPINLSNTVAADFMTDWDENDRILFNTYQKRILVPFFNFKSNKLPSYIFNEHIRLPWLKYERVSVGMNGVVHQIQIHPSHHNYVSVKEPKGPQYFALKEIQAHDRDSYKKELSALEKALGKTQTEKHLIKLLLTFQHGERFYLVFEWADGNLLQFWEQQDMVTGGLNNQWAVTQCLGLATALKRIHGLSTWQKKEREGLPMDSSKFERDYGRHGDIKAENILWFETYGTERNHLVLSDLGLTRYHSYLTRSQVRHSDLDGMTRKYRAPEVDLGVNISPSYDIWSLGCVYLEFFIWYLMGAKGVWEFEGQLLKETEGKIVNFQEANLFNIEESPGGQKKAVRKPAVEQVRSQLRDIGTELIVTQWINKLRDDHSCQQFLHDMLDLVEEHMIVVEAKNRWKIDQICIEISTIRSSLPTTRETEKPSTLSLSRSSSVSRKQLDEAMRGVSTNPMQHDTGTDDMSDDGLQTSQDTSDGIESSQNKPFSTGSPGPSQEVVDVLKKVGYRFLQDGESAKPGEPGVRGEGDTEGSR